MFQIKDFNSITLSEINHARAVTEKITDFNVGSVARTLLEAPAAEIEELYIQMFLGLRDAIPVATFNSFGFDRLPGAVATGNVYVAVESPLLEAITIPAGTQFTTSDGRTYLSLAQVVWDAGETDVVVPVSHISEGVAGNAVAGAITGSQFFNSSEFTVSNAAIANGKDAESDTDREIRFADFIRSLSRGTVAACLYAARSATVLTTGGAIAEYVVRVGYAERPGVLSLYLRSTLGEPSDALLTAAQVLLDGTRDEESNVITPGYRPAGVRVDVLPIIDQPVSLAISVAMVPGYTLTNGVRQQLGVQFASILQDVAPGTTLLLDTLVQRLLVVPGVLSIVPDSNSNIVCAANQALVPGTLTISAA